MRIWPQPIARSAREFMAAQARGDLSQAGVFWSVGSDSRAKLLAKLHDIHVAGWHDSMRLDGAGNTIAYVARNGAGYTLEAIFGIRPNGRAEPDFAGWEIKAFGSSRITLMTPNLMSVSTGHTVWKRLSASTAMTREETFYISPAYTDSGVFATGLGRR